MSLQRIKDGCHIDELTGCWIWKGAMSANRYPRVHAPDHGQGGAKRVQTGARAVWQAHTGKSIPPGHRVYHHKCQHEACLNPAHLACGPTGDWGRTVSQSNQWKGQPKRISANRAIGRKRSVVSLQTLQDIQASEETGRALALRLGLNESIVSKAKRGQLTSLQVLANPFAGLL